MVLAEPNDSPYDLRIRLGGVPVRITPWFWAVHGGLGLLIAGGDWLLFAAWVGGVLLSLLVHEFGHVLAGRAFGAGGGRVVLTPFYGLALDCADVPERYQRILVYLAGVAAQLVLALILWAVYAETPQPQLNDLVPEDFDPREVAAMADRIHAAFRFHIALAMVLGMNWVWPLVNLLPIPPLDGYQVFRELWQGSSGGRAPWERDADWWKRG
jgi:Zn-dependent protease